MLTREISRFGHIIQPLSPWSCGSYWLMAFKSQRRRTYSNCFLKNIFKSFSNNTKYDDLNKTTKWLSMYAPSATTHRSTRRTDWKGIMFRIIRKLRDAFSHAVFVTKTDLKLNGRNIFTWSLRIGRPSIATYAGMKTSNRPLHYDSISSGTTQKEKQDTTIRYESF